MINFPLISLNLGIVCLRTQPILGKITLFCNHYTSGLYIVFGSIQRCFSRNWKLVAIGVTSSMDPGFILFSQRKDLIAEKLITYVKSDSTDHRKGAWDHLSLLKKKTTKWSKCQIYLHVNPLGSFLWWWRAKCSHPGVGDWDISVFWTSAGKSGRPFLHRSLLSSTDEACLEQDIFA